MVVHALMPAAEAETGEQTAVNILRALALQRETLTDGHTATDDNGWKVHAQNGGKRCAIGVVLEGTVDGKVMVRGLVHRGPAEACGSLVVGDEMLEIDGHKVVGMSVGAVRRMLGAAGTDVHVLIRRGDELIDVRVPKARDAGAWSV